MTSLLATLGASFALCIACRGGFAAEPDRLRGLMTPNISSKPLRIGVTIVHLNDDFWKGIAYGISDEAARAHVKVVQISVAGGYGNVTQQFSQIASLKTLGVDVAVVGPAAFNGYDTVFEGLQKSGIMVVAAGIPVNSTHVDFGVTQDDGAIGRDLATAICKDQDGDKTTALALPGPAGAEWARLRVVGFSEEAKACGLSVVAGPVGGAIDIGYGMSETSDMLLKHPEARYVFTPETALGMGAVQAVRQQHRDAKVVTSTVVTEAIPMIEHGRILALNSEPGVLMGRLIVQTAIREREHQAVPRLSRPAGSPYPTLVVPNVLITKLNASTYPYQVYDIPPAGWSIGAVQ